MRSLCTITAYDTPSDRSSGIPTIHLGFWITVTDERIKLYSRVTSFGLSAAFDDFVRSATEMYKADTSLDTLKAIVRQGDNGTAYVIDEEALLSCATQRRKVMMRIARGISQIKTCRVEWFEDASEYRRRTTSGR